MKSGEIFLDTSVAIARVVHGPDMKRRITARLSEYNAKVISLVVRQEFKRRLLKEAQYLLSQLNDKGSYQRVLRHVTSVLGSWKDRKRNICLETLVLIYEDKHGKALSDKELTERAKRTLRSLIRTGLNDLRSIAENEVQDSDCACAQCPIVEKTKYKKFDFGPDECNKAQSACGIPEFLKSNEPELREIAAHLDKLSVKTEELKRASSFIDHVIPDFDRALLQNPCLTVGDLIIALESKGIKTFYTLNHKESIHLARVLNQNLIVRPKNPEHDDKVYLTSDSNWT